MSQGVRGSLRCSEAELSEAQRDALREAIRSFLADEPERDDRGWEVYLIEVVHAPGNLSKVLQVVGNEGLTIEGLQIIERTQQKTIIMEIPLVFLYAILPLMGTMMLIRAIQVIYQDITEQRAQKNET